MKGLEEGLLRDRRTLLGDGQSILDCAGGYVNVMQFTDAGLCLNKAAKLKETLNFTIKSQPHTLLW